MIIKKILSNEIGKKIILLGNEAVVRGAVEGGINVAATYPGTPSSEIGDTFSEIAKEANIYFEYSVNEKVAFETVYAASLSGARSLVSFKQYGFNVASDTILPSAYIGVNGGLIIAVADDPSCYSSAQSEQDTRYYSRIAHIPTLDPSDPDECRKFTKLGFKISEEFDLPVILRLTTKVSHSRGVVNLEKIQKKNNNFEFRKNEEKFNVMPPRILIKHEKLLEKINKAQKFSESSDLNKIFFESVKSDFAIIASGVSFLYVMDALNFLNVRLPVLKIGMSYPIPRKKIEDFIKKYEKILIAEEIEPIIEEEVIKIAKYANPKLKIYGKGYLPAVGENSIRSLISAISKILNLNNNLNIENHLKLFKEKISKLNIPRRTAVLCPGCPHRASFYAAKKAAGNDCIFGGDIGCYILGIYTPLNTQDFVFSMGAVQGITHGIKKIKNQKVISFIGDSTFYHAGIPGLINMVYNKSNPLVIVLDNRVTAMTGHQPHPGTGKTGMNENTLELKIEDVAKACGVKNVKVVNPFNLKETENAIKEFINKEEVSLIVSKKECWLLHARKLRREGRRTPKFMIDQKKCTKCGICVYEFGCPAFEIRKDGSYIINDLCLGCAVCVQVCPYRAIRAEVVAR